MKRIKLFVFITLLSLLVSCTSEPATLTELTGSTVIEEAVLEEEEALSEEPQTATVQYYDFTEGETREVFGHTITVTTISTSAMIDILVDNDATSIKETKSEEIVGRLKISIEAFDYGYAPKGETFVTMKFEELELEDNELIIEKGVRQTVGNKDILLESSRTDGAIYVSVYGKGTTIGDTQKIHTGETVEVYGLKITNIKNYYKVRQYAWVLVE